MKKKTKKLSEAFFKRNIIILSLTSIPIRTSTTTWTGVMFLKPVFHMCQMTTMIT